MEFIKILGIIADVISIALGLATIVAAYSVVSFAKYLPVHYDFFKPVGLGIIDAIKVLFYARKDTINNLRFFMEFAILKHHITRGEDGKYFSRAIWKKVIEEYKAELCKTNTDFFISIKNTYVLTRDDTKGTIDAYFEHLKTAKVRNVFMQDDTKPLQLVAQISISTGYATPLLPILSLQTEYKNDWSQILERFTRERTEEAISNGELFGLYNWLMWGPSVHTCNNNVSEFKVARFGLGDEMSGVTFTMLPECDLWDCITKGKGLGKRIKGTFKVFEETKYLKIYGNRLNSVSLDILKENCEDGRNENFILELQDYSPIQETDKKYLFSAYIWILLLWEDEENLGFDPVRFVAFFEHANLADSENYEFLKICLCDKLFSHIRKVFSVPDLSKRKYTLIWALNDDITTKVKSEKAALIANSTECGKFRNALNTRFITEQTYYPSVIYHYLEEYFSHSRDGNIRFNKIDLEQTTGKATFGAFYVSVMHEAFPDTDERESSENIVAQYQRFKNVPNIEHIIIIAQSKDRIWGGIIGDLFIADRVAVIEYVAVEKTLRGRGLGDALVSEFKTSCQKVCKDLQYIFLEIEEKNVAFWRKPHFNALQIKGFDYIQPALSANKQPCRNLNLYVLKLGKDPLTAKYLLRFLANFFGYAFGISNPEKISEYVEMQEFLKNKNVLTLT
jgi:GNAT superfamily N-acetyltransferase